MKTALAVAAVWIGISFAPVVLLIAAREWNRVKGGVHPASLPEIPDWADEPACPDCIPRSWTA